MSVLIKGMEMPTSCARCPMLEGDRFDGMCHAASKWLDDDEFWEWFVYPEGDVDESKPCNCPLVPVPPHGRLIDEDALMNSLPMEYHSVVMAINTAPTIIEAEEEEHGRD